MAEENTPNELNAGLMKSFINRAVKSIKDGFEDNEKSFKETIDDNVQKIKEYDIGAVSKMKLTTEAMGTGTEMAIDKFLKDSGIADITETMDGLKTKIDNVKETLEKNGQSTENALVKSPEEEYKALDEIRKYGKTLSGFEKTFVKFAGGTFEDMKKSIEEGGKFTGVEIAKSFGNDLKSDFDKLLAFFGPIGGLLQQIPLLGTIMNLVMNGVKSIGVRIALGLKRQLFFEGKEDARESRAIGVDAANLKLSQRAAYRDEIRFRQEQKDRLARKTGVGTAAGPGDTNVDESGDTNMKFGFMIPFLTLANMFGKGIGKGLFAIGAGFSALGKGLARGAAGLGKFLVIGGVALGVGLSAIFGAFALGRKTGAFKGMKEFEDINIVKVGAAIVGIGAMIAGFGLLLAGPQAIGVLAGLAAIALLSSGLYLIGSAAGSFARNVGAFETLDASAIKNNIIKLKEAGIGELLDEMGSGSLFGSLFTSPLVIAAQALQHYEKDMTKSIENLGNLKTAIKDFNLPETSFAEAIADFFGVGGVDQMQRLTGIEVAAEMGDNLTSFGDGVDRIASAFNRMDDTKLDRLQKFANAMKDMKIENMNFGTLPVISANMTPASQPNQQPVTINAPIQSLQQQSNTNVTKSFSATGARMGTHSALHYGSLG